MVRKVYTNVFDAINLDTLICAMERYSFLGMNMITKCMNVSENEILKSLNPLSKYIETIQQNT
ncbi:hypothetical protein ARALYDRAFT_899460 [Arabidopsis lyrata subsp. lyrata]|uniref:Uncharacterized protein n=1 Tax=Arabidopsis lyrata subsp. lyrata TaxID=81972 RepID=D7LAA1_ARALL|nr:hypothetical protein ARALYDRAFT_899460 [Arabidopsis lyrata subsp. lyrata]